MYWCKHQLMGPTWESTWLPWPGFGAMDNRSRRRAQQASGTSRIALTSGCGVRVAGSDTELGLLPVCQGPAILRYAGHDPADLLHMLFGKY